MSEKKEIVVDTTDIIKEMNIYQKIHAISSEIGMIQMTLNVDTGKGKSYKAISINDVVDALIPLMNKYRLVVLPGEKELLAEEQIKTTTSYGERTQFFVRMRAQFKIVNIDKPEEMVLAEGYGDGIDSGDKALGKANTYARKYALIDAFNLSKGDDPDREASQEYQKIEPATPEQIQKVLELYNKEEIAKMLKRMKKSNPSEISKAEAQKMIDKRDLSLVAAKVESF